MSRSRAVTTRHNLIARLVQERMEEVERNSSKKLHTQESLAKAIEWSVGTVRDDIKDMQAEGQPITFDKRRNGYIYTEKFAGIPTAFISESDLAKLCLALRALESLDSSPAFTPIKRAADKLTRVLTDEFGIDVEALKSTVTFRTTGVDALTDPAVLESLMHAIANREELEVIYSKLNRDDTRVEASVPDACDSAKPSPNFPPSSALGPQPSAPNSPTTIPFPTAPWLQMPIETRKVHPLHILCQDNAWYLWLWDAVRKDKRSFSLSRIRSLAKTGKTFKPRKFDIELELQDLMGITSGKPVDIKVQFRRKASYLVAERPWHRSQKLAPGPDSEWNLELTMHVAITPELIKWLMGYDEDFRVIDPTRLKEVTDRKVDGMVAVRRGQD